MQYVYRIFAMKIKQNTKNVRQAPVSPTAKANSNYIGTLTTLEPKHEALRRAE